MAETGRQRGKKAEASKNGRIIRKKGQKVPG
jgi:hypothetical protein